MGQTKIKFEWIDAGFQQIISSGEVNAVVRSAGERIASVAGDGFECVDWHTRGLRYDRPGVLVVSQTYEAKKAEAKNKALSKAVASCRC